MAGPLSIVPDQFTDWGKQPIANSKDTLVTGDFCSPHELITFTIQSTTIILRLYSMMCTWNVLQKEIQRGVQLWVICLYNLYFCNL